MIPDGESQGSPVSHAVLVAVFPVFIALLTVPLLLPQPIPVRLARYPTDAVLLWLLARPVVALAVTVDCRSVFGGMPDGLDARRYALLALVLPFATAVMYLFFRSEQRSSPDGGSRYWVVLVGAAVVGVFLLYTAELLVLVAAVTGTPVRVDGTLVTRLKALGGLLFLPLLPVAAYMDSRYLQTSGSDWQPNPGWQLALALCATLPLFLLVPVYVVHHLRRRAGG